MTETLFFLCKLVVLPALILWLVALLWKHATRATTENRTNYGLYVRDSSALTLETLRAAIVAYEPPGEAWARQI